MWVWKQLDKLRNYASAWDDGKKVPGHKIIQQTIWNTKKT